jgi:hypothetical protein
VPLPVPPVTTGVIQEAFALTVHGQPACVLTVRVAEPPVSETFNCEELVERVQAVRFTGTDTKFVESLLVATRSWPETIPLRPLGLAVTVNVAGVRPELGLTDNQDDVDVMLTVVGASAAIVSCCEGRLVVSST